MCGIRKLKTFLFRYLIEVIEFSSYIWFFLFGLFTEGCNAYGYACYGGHGKRSLHTQPGESTGMELNDLQERPDTVVQFYPSEANVLIDGNLEAIPRYKLIKMMKSWVSKCTN